MENQRTRISKQMLKKALVELMKQKDANKISVRELCATAQINRTTFYKYYHDTQDLLDEVMMDYFHDLERIFKDLPGKDGERLTRFLEYCLEHKDLALIMADSPEVFKYVKASPYIQFDIQAMNDAEKQKDPTKYEYLFSYFRGGFSNIIKDWLSKDIPESPQYIASLMVTLSRFQTTV